MDYGRGFDFHKQVQIDDFNILLIHGTQLRPRGNIKQLWEIVMNVGANVGIHGHTHEPAIDLREGRLLLNPGTISGATGGWAGKTDASFIELEIGGSQLTVLLHITDWQVAKQSSLQFVRQNEEIVRG
jgi:putative phosphoesterase